MRWADIKLKTEAELEEALSEARAQLVDFRFRAATGALKQVHEVKVRRRRIGRLLTRLAQLAKEGKII